MLRAFRSELTKFRRWSVLGGGGALIVVTALFSYLHINEVTPGKGSEVAASLPTTQGLVTLLAGAEPLMAAIAIILVAANVAAEWSQGTLRNLLVREPGRLRLLAGKMLALLLFTVLCAALALLAGAGVILAGAQAKGISTAPWTGTEGLNTFFSFFGNELLGLVGVSLLGMLIAVLSRSATAAVGIALAYVLVGEALIGLVWPDGAEWLPAHVFGYLPGTTSPMAYGIAPQGYNATLIVALLWMVGFVMLGFAAFKFRDVSA